jgi:hypothetical protein
MIVVKICRERMMKASTFYMNPRGFILGLSFVALLITGAFLIRGNYGSVVAFLTTSHAQTAAAAAAPIVQSI